MRRLIVGAALAGIVLTGAAACGGEKADDTAGGGTPTATATTPSVDVSANTKEVCASAEKALTDAITKFSTEAPAQIAAAQAGGADAQQAAVAAVKKAFADWGTLLRTEAEKAADPGLKQALTDTATQLEGVGTNIKSFQDVQQLDKLMNNPALTNAGQSIEKYCPS